MLLVLGTEKIDRKNLGAETTKKQKNPKPREIAEDFNKQVVNYSYKF